MAGCPESWELLPSSVNEGFPGCAVLSLRDEPCGPCTLACSGRCGPELPGPDRRRRRRAACPPGAPPVCRPGRPVVLLLGEDCGGAGRRTLGTLYRPADTRSDRPGRGGFLQYRPCLSICACTPSFPSSTAPPASTTWSAWPPRTVSRPWGFPTSPTCLARSRCTHLRAKRGFNPSSRPTYGWSPKRRARPPRACCSSSRIARATCACANCWAKPGRPRGSAATPG